MALSITDILNDLGVSEQKEAPKPVVLDSVNKEPVVQPETDVNKVAQYLEYLASPDSVIDELAKLAVLQDFISQRNIPMEKVASLSFEVTDETKETLLKTAASLLVELNTKVNDLTNKAEARNFAEKIASKLYQAGHIDASSILEKVAELAAQDKDELKTLDRALDLTKEGGRVNLGMLSSRPDYSDNPLLDLIFS